MPSSGYLKYLFREKPAFNDAGASIFKNAEPATPPSLSEALADGMLSSRSGMFSRVALSSR